MGNDYESRRMQVRCPRCDGMLLIRNGGYSCVDDDCGWFAPIPAVNYTEVKKPKEPEFVPPKRHPHPGRDS